MPLILKNGNSHLDSQLLKTSPCLKLPSWNIHFPAGTKQKRTFAQPWSVPPAGSISPSSCPPGSTSSANSLFPKKHQIRHVVFKKHHVKLAKYPKVTSLIFLICCFWPCWPQNHHSTSSVRFRTFSLVPPGTSFFSIVSWAFFFSSHRLVGRSLGKMVPFFGGKKTVSMICWNQKCHTVT